MSEDRAGRRRVLRRGRPADAAPGEAGTTTFVRTARAGTTTFRLGSTARHIVVASRHRVRPVAEVVTPLGWAAIAGAVTCGVAAALAGWSELLILALVLAVALGAALLFLIGRATFEVTVELSPRRVVVGERALGRLAVRNVASRASTPVLIELPVGSGVVQFRLPALAAGTEQEELFAVPTHQRAVIVAGPAHSVRGDALGLFRRAQRWNEPVELFVHPKTVRLQPAVTGVMRDLEGQVTRVITNNDMSFHALRDYVVGDDVRFVHWRSSARTGTLMVRQFEETRRSTITMLLSQDARYYADEAEFELAVSVAASISAQLASDGTGVTVVTEGRRLRSHSRTALLDDFCRLALREGQVASARAFAREATATVPSPSVVFTVAGSGLGPAEHRDIARLFGADVVVVAVTVAAGAAPMARTVSGLRMVTIGELGEVNRVLGRIG